MTWTGLASLPTARTGLGAAAVSGLIYAIGGMTAKGDYTKVTDLVEMYDTAAKTWSVGVAIPTARQRFAVAVISGKIYAVGGQDSTGTASTVLECFDPTAGAWSTLAPIPTGRWDLAAAVVGGKLVVSGGVTGLDAGSWVPCDNVDEYDPATNTWSALPAIPGPVAGHAAAVDGNGLMHLVGGLAGTIAHRAYDPTAQTWSTKASMPTSRGELVLALLASKLYAIGGDHDSTDTYRKVVEMYDPSTDTWSTSEWLSHPHQAPGAATISAQAYILGGETSTSVTPYVEAWAPAVPPNAPTLLSPADNATLDLTVDNTFSWAFSDDDFGDSQSAFNFYYRIVGAANWTMLSGTADQFETVAANVLAAGDYEWQVETKDQDGNLGPRSTSRFFTAATPPAAPTWSSPADGAALDTAIVDFTFSVSGSIDSSEWRRCDDATGTTVYASGTGGAAQRTFTLTFDTTGRTEHVQVRVFAGGLWSAWTDSSHQINYSPPATPSLVATADDATASITVAMTNPAPGVGQPDVASNDVFRRLASDTSDGIRVATGVAPNGSWTDYTPGSAAAYQYKARAIGVDGTVADGDWTPA